LKTFFTEATQKYDNIEIKNIMHSMEKTNTDPHEIEINCPATEVKELQESG
jgi:hypothetical protein